MSNAYSLFGIWYSMLTLCIRYKLPSKFKASPSLALKWKLIFLIFESLNASNVLKNMVDFPNHVRPDFIVLFSLESILLYLWTWYRKYVSALEFQFRIRQRKLHVNLYSFHEQFIWGIKYHEKSVNLLPKPTANV